MAITFVCPTCHGTHRVESESAGQLVRCGECRTALRVPGGPERPPATPEPVEPTTPVLSESGWETLDDPPPRRRRRLRRPPPPPRVGGSPLFWLGMTGLAFAVLIVAGCGGMFYLIQPKWRTHESAFGGFRVDLPAKPRLDIETQARMNTQPGVHIEGTYLLGDLEEYTVAFSEIDDNQRAIFNDQILLANAIRRYQNDFPGTSLLREGPVTVSGFPGKEVVFTHPTGGSWITRFVVAESRLYVLTAGGATMKANGNDRARRFLDSFTVTDPALLLGRDEKRRAQAAGRQVPEPPMFVFPDEEDVEDAAAEVTQEVFQAAMEEREKALRQRRKGPR